MPAPSPPPVEYVVDLVDGRSHLVGVECRFAAIGAREALDLRGGAYLKGGFVADARLRSPMATTKIRYDRLPGARAPMLLGPEAASGNADDGLLVDARGASTGNQRCSFSTCGTYASALGSRAERSAPRRKVLLSHPSCSTGVTGR